MLGWIATDVMPGWLCSHDARRACSPSLRLICTLVSSKRPSVVAFDREPGSERLPGVFVVDGTAQSRLTGLWVAVLAVGRDGRAHPRDVGTVSMVPSGSTARPIIVDRSDIAGTIASLGCSSTRSTTCSRMAPHDLARVADLAGRLAPWSSSRQRSPRLRSAAWPTTSSPPSDVGYAQISCGARCRCSTRKARVIERVARVLDERTGGYAPPEHWSRTRLLADVRAAGGLPLTQRQVPLAGRDAAHWRRSMPRTRMRSSSSRRTAVGGMTESWLRPGSQRDRDGAGRLADPSLRPRAVRGDLAEVCAIVYETRARLDYSPGRPSPTPASPPPRCTSE